MGNGAPMVHVGASEDSLRAVGEQILRILNWGEVEDSPTKIQALQTLQTLAKVEHVTVSHNTFTQNVTDAPKPRRRRVGRPRKGGGPDGH